MKRILVVFTTAFVPYGGLTTVMMNYWRAMDKSDFHFDFASTNDPPSELLNEIEGAGGKYIKLPRRKNILQYFFRLKDLCNGYDVVHVHGNSSTSIIELLAAKMADVPKRIVHNHNSITGYPIINKLLHPFFLKSYTDAVACSRLAGDWLFGTNNFIVLRNAININKFSVNESIRQYWRNKWSIPEDSFVVGHVGKFTKQKNHSFLINVFAEYNKLNPNSFLLLVGAGNLENELRNQVCNLGLDEKVIFAGLRTDIPDMMNVMDLFLFPSLWEGLPLSAIEAQASGLPVFLSDVISSEVCISSNVFSLSLSDSYEHWAKQIYDFVCDKSRSLVQSDNWKSITEAGYNISHEANELIRIYND